MYHLAKLKNLFDVDGIALVRHAHTSLNNEDPLKDRIRGWQNIGLDALGKEQAREMAQEFNGLKPNLIITSDLSRAIETAESIAEVTQTKDVILNDGFRPWHLGRFEGEVTGEVIDELEHIVRESPDEIIRGGESFNQFSHRVINALRLIEHDVEEGKLHNVVIVSHFRNLKLIEAWVAGGEKGYTIDIDTFLSDDTKPGSVFFLYKDKDKGGWELDKEFQPKQKKSGLEKNCARVE